MAKLVPQVNFLVMGSRDWAEFGMQRAQAHFDDLLTVGAVNGDSLYVEIGELENERFVERATEGFGPDWQQFVENVSAFKGKIATVVRYRINSIDAFYEFGEEVGEGARQWTGGVIHVARVRLKSGRWLQRIFVGAASGVQGHFDMSTVYTALASAGGAWAQHELAVELEALQPGGTGN